MRARFIRLVCFKVAVIQSCPVYRCVHRPSVAPLCTQITNDGNIDLLDATIVSADIALDCDKHERFDVGESFVCAGTRKISESDVTKGWSDSSAT